MNNTTQSSFEQEDSFTTTALKVASLLLFILVGVLGNGRVIYTVLVVDVIRPVLNRFIASLSFADLASCVIMPFVFVSLVSGEWLFGQIFCAVHSTLHVYLANVTSLNVAAMVYERYHAIYRKRFPSLTHRERSLLLCFVWMFPIPFTASMLRQEFTYVKQVGMCFTVTKDWNVLPIVIKVSVSVVGLLLVLFSFWKIFSFLLPLRRRVSPRLRSNQEKLMLAAHMQSARTMIVFVLVYLVLVVPKFVVCILTNRRAQPVTRAIENDDLFCAFQWLYWLQCACKPIIYFLRSRRCISCLRKYCGPAMINENMTSCFSTSRSPLYEGNGNNLANTSSSVPSHQEREFLNLCRTSIELVPITNTARSVPEQGRTAEESTPQSIEVLPVSTENVVQYSDVFFEDLESNNDTGEEQTTPS